MPMKKDNELHVYDFDLTLFKSPEEPDWWDKKVLGYWYGVYPSLSEPFIDRLAPASYWYRDVVREAKKSIQNRKVWAVMCTGRTDKVPLRFRVAELLKQRNLNFDQVFLNGMGVKTPPYKKRVVYEILKSYPLITKVQMWEDNQDNLDEVEHLCGVLGVSFEGHFLNHQATPANHVSKEEFLDFLTQIYDEYEIEKIRKKLDR